MRAVFRKELRLGLTGFAWYAYCGAILLTVGICGVVRNLQQGNPDFAVALRPGLFAIIGATPLLTMGLFCDERRQNTQRLLRSLPLRPCAVSLGKCFASLIPLLVVCLVLLISPFLLAAAGAASIKTALGMLLGLMAFGLLCFGWGFFQASLASGWLDAFLLTLLPLLVCCFASQLNTYMGSVQAPFLQMVLWACLAFLLVYAFCRKTTVALAGAIIGALGGFWMMQMGQAVTRGVISAVFQGVGFFDAISRLEMGLFDADSLVRCLILAVLFVCMGCFVYAWDGKRKGGSRNV